MSKKEHYDIFVSYRRKDINGNDNSPIARSIKKELESLGYKVFFDYSELRDGEFEEKILPAIANAKIFVLVLTPHALDRCADEGDWVRREIEQAQGNNLKIIPVNVDDKFGEIPAGVPNHIKGVRRIQDSTIYMGSSFERDIKAMDEERIAPYITYIKKKRQVELFSVLCKWGIVGVGIILLVFSLFLLISKCSGKIEPIKPDDPTTIVGVDTLSSVLLVDTLGNSERERLAQERAKLEQEKAELEKRREEMRIAEEAKAKAEAEERARIARAEQERKAAEEREQKEEAEHKRQETERKRKEAAASASNYHNGHEYVDLGLSVKWATCNVGANSPEKYGNYYAWGEIEVKASYTKENSKTWGKSLGDIGGNPSHDAARAAWGGSWRLPTKAELEELKDNCEWKWTTQGGKKGYQVTSKVNGKSIFLPAAGYRDGTSLGSGGSLGYYWSSTPGESNTYDAYNLYFNSGNHNVGWDIRNYGFSVRPVVE